MMSISVGIGLYPYVVRRQKALFSSDTSVIIFENLNNSKKYVVFETEFAIVRLVIFGKRRSDAGP